MLLTLLLAFLPTTAALDANLSAPGVRVHRVEGKPLAADRVQLGAAAVTLTIEGSEQSLSVRNVWHIEFDRGVSRPATPREICLANDDRLFAEPVETHGSTLNVVSAGGEKLAIPLVAVRYFVVAAPKMPADVLRLVRRLRQPPDRDDLVVLRNGDVATGRFMKLAADGVHLRLDGGTRIVPRDGVAGVGLNPRFARPPKLEGTYAVVSLTDGSWLHVHKPVVDSVSLTCELPFGGKWSVPIERVLAIRLAGQRVRPLSTMSPSKYEYTPYVSGDWPLAVNRGLTGDALKLNGRTYPIGVSMHSRSRATYALVGGWKRFRATVGLDDSTAGRGAALVSVQIDDREVLPPRLVTDETVDVNVDVQGGRRLTLLVDYGPRADVLDRIVWADAILIRD